MGTLTEQTDQRVKVQADEGLRLVKSGLAKFKDILEMIERVNSRRESLENSAKRIETIVQELEQEVKKLSS